MALEPKTITVLDAHGKKSTESVANDFEFNGLTADYNVRCLVTNDSVQKKIRGFTSLVEGGTYTLGPPNHDAPLPKKFRAMTYVKGVDPNGPFTLKRKAVIELVLSKLQRSAMVVMKGPAGLGKSSIMNLVANLLTESSSNYGFSGSQYTFMEKEGLAPRDQLNDALRKLGDFAPDSLPRILLCDDIQNVPHSFWEKLHTEADWFTNNNVRILAATTRRCSSDPASPTFPTESTVNFEQLRFSEEEFDTYSDLYLPFKNNIGLLGEEGLESVLKAAREQCAGHLYAFQVTIDALDDMCNKSENREPGLLISMLLSRKFLDAVYTRIWLPRNDSVTITEHRFLQSAMVRESEKLSVDLQITLMKMYFLQDSNQMLVERSWSEVKKEATFPLASRRLHSLIFECRGEDNFQSKDVLDLVLQTLKGFKRVDLEQAATSSSAAFPREGALQLMFFRSITSLLPASTEVVAEMLAILPDRGDGKKGELDFYVNSGYYYGIELMRDGGSFEGHKERFQSPKRGNKNRGNYFTPLIRDFLIVDFRGLDFQPKKHDKFRLNVSFSADFASCALQCGTKDLGTINFT